MNFKTLIHKKEGEIVRLTLNRPEAGNAVNIEMARELEDICRTINEYGSVRSVILTGSGERFSSGVDILELLSLEGNTAHPARVGAGALASLTCPVIAAVNGDALGGGLELALACDIRICSETARFGFPETASGLIPGGGGTQRLPRIVGRARAIEMILLGRIIDADEAYRIGLVTRVAPSAKLAEEALGIAKTICEKAPVAARYAREAIGKGMDMTLEQGLRLEADLSFLLQTTSDRDEGIRAFLEKRKPRFTGD